MIQISLKGELLDINTDTLVTFKKAQQLNGIQDLYSYSNNFTILNSSKNRRLLGISYLPNSKAKSMTAGYEVDVVLSNCIYLKKQKLKVQKEPKDNIPVYLIFTDSFLVAKAKEVLMNQIETGVDYTKNLANFISRNYPFTPETRTAPISAQDKSGLVVVEEVPILLNLKNLVLTVFTALGYSYTGDILTDENIGKYYISSNVGVYGPDGTPRFADTYTCYDFLLDFLETFNGYIEPSDSAKSVGLYFWKNIETIKDNFVDYSDKFTGSTEYTFEGGLARLNTMAYSDSPDFYNGFFKNNKSIVDKTQYLESDFGAGSLRLFADQEPEEDGTLLPRTIGEVTEPQTLNIFRFEETFTTVAIYSGGGIQYIGMYKAFSPNILEIYQLFHQAYTDNISQPTIDLINFRYDAIFLANFKMAQVFFIKQLATYWLPLELSFTSKKDGIKVKALMIEKTPVEVPEVFDFNISVDFYGETLINDINLLYSALNTSKAGTMIITAADLSKNNIYVNGTQILAFPTSVDVSAAFQFKAESIGPDNDISNSNVKFRFVSEAGGVSREANINVAHNGRANFLSEFRSATDVLYTYGRDDVSGFKRHLNYSAKVTSPINIADTYAPMIGDVDTPADVVTSFKALQFDRASTVTVELRIGYLLVHCSNRGGRAEARTKMFFNLSNAGGAILTVYYAGAIDYMKGSDSNIVFNNVFVTKTFNVNAGDIIALDILMDCSEEDRPGSGNMDGSVSMKNVNWKFYVTEQL